MEAGAAMAAARPALPAAGATLPVTLDVARGAGMVRGVEVLRCRTGDAACTVELAPDLARQRDWSGRAGPTGSTGTTRPRPQSRRLSSGLTVSSSKLSITSARSASANLM